MGKVAGIEDKKRWRLIFPGTSWHDTGGLCISLKIPFGFSAPPPTSQLREEGRRMVSQAAVALYQGRARLPPTPSLHTQGGNLLPAPSPSKLPKSHPAASPSPSQATVLTMAHMLRNADGLKAARPSHSPLGEKRVYLLSLNDFFDRFFSVHQQRTHMSEHTIHHTCL